MPDNSWWRHVAAKHDVSSAEPAPAAEHELWRVTKGDRTAYAAVRRLPHGKDLVFYVGAELMESQLFKPDQDQALLERAEEKRQAFLEKGWS